MKSNVLLVTLSAAVLASCGTSGASSGPTTLGLTPTNYVTVTQTPTTLTTTTVAGGGVGGTVHAEEGTYTIAAGDLPSTIARKFKVKFTDLMAINSWTLVGQQVPEFPSIGTTIRIPPGWTDPGAAPVVSTGGSTPPATGTTTTLAGGVAACAPGEYTILADDTSRSKVAKKLDTTVAALDAANAATPGYTSFYPGLKIKTPPKANC